MPEEDNGPRLDATSVDAAIAQVLQAEREARASVQRCAAEAEALVDSAQQRARLIARRAAHRSVRVQRWYAAMLQRQLEAIAQQQAAVAEAPIAAAGATARRDAVAALAAQLSGPA
jgi:vacuolar-type H+-ATPase subunit H